MVESSSSLLSSTEDEHVMESDGSVTDWGLLPDEIAVWVKDIPFEFGTFPVFPCAKISLPILRNMVSYCRARNMDNLSLGAWCHMCKSQMKLKHELGWTYIRLYDVLFQQMSAKGQSMEQPGYWDERCDVLKLRKCDRLGEFQVPMLKFMLFLFIQHGYRMVNKFGDLPDQLPPDNILETEDDEFDETIVEREEKRTLDEEHQFDFVSKYLPLIIEFLESGEEQGPRLKLEVIDALDLILYAAKIPQTTKEYYSLKELVIEEGLADYNYVTSTADRELFVIWLKSSLRVNPWGARGLMKWSIPDLITGVTDEIFFVHSRRENRIMRSDKIAPVHWYTIEDVNNQVLYIKEFELNAFVRVYKCNRSYLYLTRSLACVSIEKCKDCLIFLGCVSGVVRMTSCSRTTVIGLARQVIVSETVLSALHIHTPCPPILAGSCNSQLLIGPYTTFFSRLELEMAWARFGPALSLWDKVVGLKMQGLLVNCDEQWSMVDGTTISEFIFPFSMEGRTISNPVQLQARHNWALMKKEKLVTEWTCKKTLAVKHGLDKNQVDAFLGFLYTRYLKYIIREGLEAEILALVSYNKARQPRCSQRQVLATTHISTGVETDSGTEEEEEFAMPRSLEQVLKVLIMRAEEPNRYRFLEEEQDKLPSPEVTETPENPSESQRSNTPNTC